MKAQIWKYTIPVQDKFELELPGGAQILSVQVQQGKPCIWAVLSPYIEEAIRRFRIVGTGHEFDLSPFDKYIGTFQLGDFVGHLFEINDRP